MRGRLPRAAPKMALILFWLTVALALVAVIKSRKGHNSGRKSVGGEQTKAKIIHQTKKSVPKGLRRLKQVKPKSSNIISSDGKTCNFWVANGGRLGNAMFDYAATYLVGKAYPGITTCMPKVKERKKGPFCEKPHAFLSLWHTILHRTGLTCSRNISPGSKSGRQAKESTQGRGYWSPNAIVKNIFLLIIFLLHPQIFLALI